MPTAYDLWKTTPDYEPDEHLCVCGTPLVCVERIDCSDEDGTRYETRGTCPECDAEPCGVGGCTALLEWDYTHDDWVCRGCDAREEAA